MLNDKIDIMLNKNSLGLLKIDAAKQSTVQLRCKVNGARELLASHSRVMRESLASHARVARVSLASRSRVTRKLLALSLIAQPSVYYTCIAISHLL